MKILVCVKQVPDTEASIQVGNDHKSIDESGIKFIMNPYDEFAVEEALRIKEALGNSTIKAIGLGPERAKEALRTAVAMGVDEVLLLKTGEPLFDGMQSAQILADAIQKESFDLILIGKETIDDGNMEIGPMVAELLQIPCVTLATKLVVNQNGVTVDREGDAGTETFTAALPTLITCQKGLNEPRYPSIRGVMLAKKKEIIEQAVAPSTAAVTASSYAYPPARKGGRILGEGAAAVPELVRLLREEAKVI